MNGDHMKRTKMLASVGAVGLFVAVAAGAAFADTDSSPDGRSWPATADPSAAPTPTDPPTPFVPEPGSQAEQLEIAEHAVEAAVGHPGTIVCLTPEGTLAGTIHADRPATAPPFTDDVKQLSCDQAWPGSRA